MIYLIDIDILLINIRKYYQELLTVVNKSVLDDFIDNCAVDNCNQTFVNIEYVNKFRNIYNNEFKYIIQLTNQRAV